MLDPESLAVVAFGFGAGVFGAVIGAGGGFLIVPVLVSVFGRAPEEAVGTTALAVMLISIAATASYLPSKRVDTRKALLVAAPGIPAAAVGSWLLAEVASGPWFAIALGVGFLLLAALILAQARPFTVPRRAVPGAGLAMGGSLVGVVTGAFAAGGGLLTVPLLMRWGALPIQRATATTALAILPSAAAAAAIQVWLGHVPARGLAVATAAALGAYAGAAWSGRWHPGGLIRITAASVAAMGLLTLGRTVLG